MIKSSIFITTVITLLCFCGFSNANESVNYVPYINHLEPCQFLGGYTEFVAKTLLNKETNRQRLGLYSSVIINPTFSPDAIIDLHIDDNGRYIILLIEAKENLRNIYKQRNGKEIKPSRFDVQIERFEREIPKEVAVLVRRVWLNMLFECRYSKNSYKGLDGCTFVFSAHKRMKGMLYGEIWSPNGGKPQALVEIVDSLVNFAKEKTENSSDVLLARIQHQCYDLLNRKGTTLFHHNLDVLSEKIPGIPSVASPNSALNNKLYESEPPKTNETIKAKVSQKCQPAHCLISTNSPPSNHP